MRTFIIAAALATVTATSVNAQSACKGLDNATCSANQACQWRSAIVKGDISPSSKKPYKVSRKAHCRRDTTKEFRAMLARQKAKREAKMSLKPATKPAE